MREVAAATMKQVVLHAVGGGFEVREVPIPKPGPEQLLVKMEAATVCKQTDLNSLKGLHPPHGTVKGDHFAYPHDLRSNNSGVGQSVHEYYPTAPYPYEIFPSLMGHEAAGKIVAMGERSASNSTEFQLGDIVTSTSIHGGFAEYFLVDSACSIKVPKSIPSELASLAEPIAVVVNTLKDTLRLGDRVAILGQGFLGLVSTILARHMGASQILVTEPVEEKRELAKKFGAHVALDPNDCHFVDEIIKLSNGGVDAIVEAAGVPETIKAIPYIAKLGANVGQIGALCSPTEVDWGYIHFKALKITTHGHAWRNAPTLWGYQRTLRLMEMGVFDKLNSLFTHRYKLDDISRAFETLEKDAASIKALILP